MSDEKRNIYTESNTTNDGINEPNKNTFSEKEGFDDITDSEFEEIKNAISKDADDIQIPDELLPDNIKKSLDMMNAKENANEKQEAMTNEKEIIENTVGVNNENPNNRADSKNSKKVFKKRKWYIPAAITAATVIIISGVLLALYNPVVRGVLGLGGDRNTIANSNNNSNNTNKLRQVGSYYLASNYKEIYSKLDSNSGGMKNGSVYDAGTTQKEESVGDASTNNSTGNSLNSTDVNSNSNDVKPSSDYSTTNVMVDGIDEADIVKINENFIYLLIKNKIKIVNISDINMKQVGEVDLGINEHIVEFYLKDSKIYVITEKEEKNLLDMIGEYFYYNTENVVTTLYTIDVSKPENPFVTGKITQDVEYYTSRFTGDYVYLFTQKYSDYFIDKSKVIPYVNGKEMAAEDIYIPRDEYIYSALVISSVNINNTSEVAKQLAVMGDGFNIYMGNNSIYLYQSKYNKTNKELETEVTKFEYNNGEIRALSAANVSGYVMDAFALSESNGKLRILTTLYDNAIRKNSSVLTLFDEGLKQTSRLDGIAPGERVYAARYIGDYVYFVTYRNMDPLFAVDIKDIYNPQILGFVEMNGYSDYLHPYKDGKLLGVGYETDPVTTRVLGIKLTMFEIKDPTHISIIDSVVIENTSYTTALDDYKQLLVDANKNLIGFTTSKQYNYKAKTYMLYTWKDNHFENVLQYELTNKSEYIEDDDSAYNIYDEYYGYYHYGFVRGVYAKDTFFIVTSNGNINSFDIKDSFKKKNEIVLYN